MVGGALIRCALLHSVCNLKAVEVNVLCSIIRELKLCHITAEEIKNFCCAKVESNRWLKKFRPGFKDIDNQPRSSRPKTRDLEAVF